jgi:hypothetical protein
MIALLKIDVIEQSQVLSNKTQFEMDMITNFPNSTAVAYCTIQDSYVGYVCSDEAHVLIESYHKALLGITAILFCLR